MLLVLFSCLFLLVASLPVSLFPSFVKKEWNEQKCLTTGTPPSWLHGIFVRQACGGFGDQAGNDAETKIQHLFDCMGMVATYKFQDGEVYYSNKLYNTHGYKVLESYQFDFTKSKIAWPTVFSPYDWKRAQEYAHNWTEAQGYYSSTANVNFWRMTSRPDGTGKYISEAVDESPHGLGFDVRTLELMGPYHFNDNIENGAIIIDNPAHGAVDEKGIRWATMGNYKFTSQSTGIITSVIYNIQNNARVIQGEYKLGEFDLALCKGDYRTVYPNLDAVQGYMHSFVMTDDYVILPQSSLIWNPCGIFLPKPNGISFFEAVTVYLPKKDSRVIVFDKKSKSFVAEIKAPPTFISHQANWYETVEEGKATKSVVADMITYEYNVYDTLGVRNFLDDFVGIRKDSKFERFTIDTGNWTLTKKEFPMPYSSKEFVHVNSNYRYKPYQFVYMLADYFLSNSTIIKYDVRNNVVDKVWRAPVRVLAGEPFFVPAPGSVNEDDGVVLVGGAILQEEVGFVAVLDAKSLTTVAFVRAPELTPIGLHNYFHPLD